MAEAAGVEVVGITVSEAQVEMAKERAVAAGVADRVRFALVDAMEMPFDGESLDAVLAIESLEHMPDHAHVLRSIATILRSRTAGRRPAHAAQGERRRQQESPP